VTGIVELVNIGPVIDISVFAFLKPRYGKLRLTINVNSRKETVKTFVVLDGRAIR
jgi:hypothetical protein